MPPNNSNSNAFTSVDVDLPLPSALALDIDLSTTPAAQVLAAETGSLFQPTLSQVAAGPSRSRLRWPGGSRAGYDGDNSGNWMLNSRVRFGERTIGGI